MGFLDFFEGAFGKKPVSGPYIFNLKYSLHPMRLTAHKKDHAILDVWVTNTADEEFLTSVVAVLPKDLGFEQLGLQQQHESRLGLLKPGEERHVRIEVWSTQKTPPGLYPLKIFAISHYRDYAHILNEVKRSLEVRVV
ncbi:MAG: hypothetical protein V1717_03825 [Candidatus Micrarchaeota archaeon]